MPYIQNIRRIEMDKVIDSMVKHGVKANGDLNYILFAYCKRYVPKNYNSIKNFNGELIETVEEIRRKILGPYEDLKEKENGEII